MTEEERELFLKTDFDLMVFAAKRKKILPAGITMSEFLETDPQIKFDCKRVIYDDPEVIDEYLASNFDHLDKDQVLIINGFKRKLESQFIILKCLQKHAIFINLSDEKVYAVSSISDPFDTLFDYFPSITTTRLIPFKDRIIFDGIFTKQDIQFGSGIRGSFNTMYIAAKRNKQIIFKLP